MSPLACIKSININPVSMRNKNNLEKMMGKLSNNMLKAKLEAYDNVDVDVICSAVGLLHHHELKGVSIKGAQWKSPQNLTCQDVNINLGVCKLDENKLRDDSYIDLKSEASGHAYVSMSFDDFNNFLKHPLMEKSMGEWEDTIKLSKCSYDESRESLVIDVYHDNGVVCYKRKFTLSNTLRIGEVRAEYIPEDDGIDKDDVSIRRLKTMIQNYFNTLIVNLDGTHLQYKHMDVNENGIYLQLYVTVNKLPIDRFNF